MILLSPQYLHSVLKLVTKINLVSSRSLKIKQKMSGLQTTYVHELDSNTFKVSFYYDNPSVGVSRQFNFERKMMETVEAFLSRVTTNLEKVVSAKRKRKNKKSETAPEEQAAEEPVIVDLISGNTSVPKESICKDVFFSKKYQIGSLKLRMINIDYAVAINFPWIDTLSLPSSIMTGFPVYPNSFETRFVDKQLSTFSWSTLKETGGTMDKGKQNAQWTCVGQGFVYSPTTADIGHKLKLECIPRNSDAVGPLSEYVSASIIEAGPGYCPFEERHLYTQDKSSKDSFRVLSYNILADVYSSTDTAQNELFNYCPTYALNIDYRKQLFLKELLGYNSDIVCLQEVDVKVFESDLVPVLGEQGLVGIHAKKSTIREGVSSFYSTSKFKLLDAEEVVLSEELQKKSYCAHILQCVNKNEPLKKRITGLGTAAQALILESLEKPDDILVVGNTHLYFHPDADHIRLLQGGILVSFLTNVVDGVKKKRPGKHVSLMCCGDFNSVPECGIYQLMTTKQVPSDLPDWKSKPEEEVKDLSLSQPFNLESACGTPPYTNYTVSFAACLDYIYYQTDRLVVDSFVPLPDDDVLREHRAIPSVVFPSDHVALVSTLRWK